MKIDVISIFPEYLAPLSLSLLGKAQSSGIVDIKVHNLRDFTNDNHNTVDDTPYGGGAGMVMLPEVWAQAIDSIIEDGAEIIILTPAGKRFSQKIAASFSSASQLIFACGRYEGIDDRIRQYYSQPEFEARKITVHEASIGDYVLGGGEVAAMVMIEAITRLIPGFMGNAESIVEESHSDGLLEYPSYTKPAVWRELEVPDVLLSGNHALIAKWRKDQQVERTKRVRPDLLPD